MMMIENKYNIGEKVFLVTDGDQLERLVTAIQISPNNLLYRLINNTTETWHFEFEISKEKNFVASSDSQKQL